MKLKWYELALTSAAVIFKLLNTSVCIFLSAVLLNVLKKFSEAKLVSANNPLLNGKIPVARNPPVAISIVVQQRRYVVNSHYLSRALSQKAINCLAILCLQRAHK